MGVRQILDPKVGLTCTSASSRWPFMTICWSLNCFATSCCGAITKETEQNQQRHGEKITKKVKTRGGGENKQEEQEKEEANVQQKMHQYKKSSLNSEEESNRSKST